MPQAIVYKPKQEAGFSFIEVVFATAILSISVLGLMTLTVTSIQSSHRTERANDSVGIASEVAEVLLEAPFDVVQSCELLASPAPTAGGGTTSAAGGYNSSNACLGVNFNLFPNPMNDSDETIGSLSTSTKITAAKRASVPYDIAWVVTPLSDDLKQININVNYDDGSGSRQHSVTVVKHREM